jgi:hypothetical protein
VPEIYDRCSSRSLLCGDDTPPEATGDPNRRDACLNDDEPDIPPTFDGFVLKSLWTDIGAGLDILSNTQIICKLQSYSWSLLAVFFIAAFNRRYY